MVNTVSLEIEGKELVLETGRMAKQANGAVFATYGGSAVLATVCCGDKPVEGLDYVPLQVEYNEKYYAAGKIPGGFLKREGRPKDKEILVSRLIDRPMRPLFHKEFGREIQVIPTVISSDQENTPDVLAMVASFAAVSISDIPFEGPIGAVRVCYINGEYIINPTFQQIDTADLEIVVAGSEEGITMVEGGAKEVSEEVLLTAIAKGKTIIDAMCAMQKELVAKCGLEKLPLTESSIKLENRDGIYNDVYPKLEEACFVKGKHIRYAAIKDVKAAAKAEYCENFDEDQMKLFEALMEEIEYNIVRKSILVNKVRTDGRGPEDIRQITCEIGVLSRTHGSALFTRGETQSLGVTTLGTVFDEQMIDDIDSEKRYSNFMLHYNFPPFSVGECGRLSTGRREIGHGHLAQRALTSILPTKEEFPYTIRVVSEILESNGSSSMATVCSGTLSLLNAGVPIKKPVAGIAMGLVTDNTNTVVLSDILGEEDHLGDMDFKVCGTEDGITAFQMDIKISGVSPEIMKTALEQAKRGRMHILGIMNETISKPMNGVSEFAPRIETVTIPEDKIGAVIGQGGKTIKALSEKFDVNINIEQDGSTTVYGKNKQATDAALKAIKGLVEDPEIGTLYTGTVKRIVDFGAFVEFLPGKEGLCHISRLSRKRINKVDEVLKLNQEIPVKIIEIDRMGRINLSYIEAVEDLEKEKK